jgi:hypothetical protein
MPGVHKLLQRTRKSVPLSIALNEMKIIKFLPEWAAIRAFSSRPTFCFDNLRYFKSIEEKPNGIGDPQEQECALYGGGSFSCGYAALVSCWSVFDKDEDYAKYSKIFKREIAVISTVDDVTNYLESHKQGVFDAPWQFEHRLVEYCNSKDRKELISNPKSAIFTKRNEKKYRDQAEYRFAFYCGSARAHLEQVLISNMIEGDFPKYVQRVILGSTSTEKKRQIVKPWFGNKGAMERFVDFWDEPEPIQEVHSTRDSRSAFATP